MREALERTLAAKGWSRRLKESEVIARWEDVAGARIAENAQPLRLEEGVLVVRAKTSTWASELSLLAPKLLERLAETFGAGLVTEVRVISGRARESGERALAPVRKTGSPRGRRGPAKPR